MLIITLNGCSAVTDAAISAINPFDNSSGGLEISPQVGKTNIKNDTKTIGISDTNDNRIEAPSAEVVNQDNSTKQELPPVIWVVGIVLLIVGWVTDTPKTMYNNFRKGEI